MQVNGTINDMSLTLVQRNLVRIYSDNVAERPTHMCVLYGHLVFCEVDMIVYDVPVMPS